MYPQNAGMWFGDFLGENINGKRENKEGAKRNSCDIAKRMLEKGIAIETISELTGLTEKEISELDRTKSR